MMTRHASPPALAKWLMAHCVPAAERDMVLGDFTEWFADRADARRPFNRCWFWTHACLFALAAVWQPVQGVRDRLSGRHLMGRFTTGMRHAVRRVRYDWRHAAGVILILAVG